MSLIKKIQSKSELTRYLILIVSVSFIMVVIIYLWFLSFDNYLNQLSENNSDAKLLPLKDSLKASIEDFTTIFSETKEKLNKLEGQFNQSQSDVLPNDFNVDNWSGKQTKNNQVLKDMEYQKELRFPNNY